MYLVREFKRAWPGSLPRSKASPFLPGAGLQEGAGASGKAQIFLMNQFGSWGSVVLPDLCSVEQTK